MQLPSFNDFLEQMDSNQTATEFSELFTPEVLLIDDVSSPENLAALYNKLLTKANQSANKIMLYYLRAYHQWLSENLSELP